MHLLWQTNDSEYTSNYSFFFELVSVIETQKMISRRKIIERKSGKFSWELNCSFVPWPAMWDCQLKLGLCCVSTAMALLRGRKAPCPVVALPLEWTQRSCRVSGEWKAGAQRGRGTARVRTVKEITKAKRTVLRASSPHGPAQIRIQL